MDVDGVAEVGEPADEPPGLGLLGAPIEVVGAEVLVGGAVLEHVVGGGQDRGGDRADRLLRPAAGAQAVELRLQVAGFLRLAAQAHWTRMVLSQGAPLRRRVERRLPALSSLRGHSPAQETRWPAVGNRLMSRPISATMTRAASAPTPGIVVSSSTAARKGARLLLDLAVDPADRRLQGIDLVEVQPQQEAMVLA